MSKVWAVAIKEFRQIGRDWLFLAMLVGLPAFMLVIFGFAVNFDVTDMRTAVQDRDHSAASRALISAFAASGRFRLVQSLEAGDALHRSFQQDRARVAIIIPADFGQRLTAGESAPVQLIFDGTDANTASTAAGYAQGVIQAFNANRLASVRSQRLPEESGLPDVRFARRLNEADWLPVDEAQRSEPGWIGVGKRNTSGRQDTRVYVAAGAGGPEPAQVRVQPRVWYNPELESSHFLVPGLIGFILMVTAVLSTALSVVREREQGTMEQLGVAPLYTAQVLMGKALPYLVISLAAVVLILVAARTLFGVAVAGSYVDLFALTALYLLGGIGLGLLISTVARNQGVAFQVGVFVSMLPTLLLSGFVFPIRNMPLLLQGLSYAVPARYYLVALRGIVLKGTSLAPYPLEVAALAAFGMLVIGLASARFSRMVV